MNPKTDKIEKIVSLIFTFKLLLINFKLKTRQKWTGQWSSNGFGIELLIKKDVWMSCQSPIVQ